MSNTSGVPDSFCLNAVDDGWPECYGTSLLVWCYQHAVHAVRTCRPPDGCHAHACGPPPDIPPGLLALLIVGLLLVLLGVVGCVALVANSHCKRHAKDTQTTSAETYTDDTALVDLTLAEEPAEA